MIKKLSGLLGLDLDYFIKGGFWLIFASVASALGGLLLSSLFSRLWPQDVYGQFAFLTSALGFISLTALPGMGQAITQAVSEGKEGIYKDASLMVAKWSIIGTVALIAGSFYFYFRENPNLAAATFASALAFPISTTASFYNSYLTGKKLFKQVAIFSTIAQYSSLIATALALYFLPSLAWVAFFSAWSTAIVNVILTCFAFFRVKNSTKDNSAINLGIHLSFSQIFTIGADYLDRFLVPVLLGFTNNAIYAFAILIPMQIHWFLKVFTTLGQPKVAEISQKNLKSGLIRKSLQLEVLTAAIVFTYILAAPSIFKILYPNYQGEAVVLSQIFSVSLLYFPGNILSLLLVRERQTKQIYKINIFYAFSTIAALAILVPTLGLIGAVLAKVIVRLLQLLTQVILFIKTEIDEG